MIFFGHLGLGLRMVRRVAGDPTGGAQLGALLAGCIAPDVLDKALLHSIGGPDAWISSGRTIGHSLGFLLVLAALSWLLRSRGAWLFTLAAVSHVLFDHCADAIAIVSGTTEMTLAVFAWGSDRMVGLCWPFLGFGFPVTPDVTPVQHVLRALTPLNIFWEVVGVVVLAPFLWRSWCIRTRTNTVPDDVVHATARPDCKG